MALVEVPELLQYMGGLKLTTDQEGITETVILPGVQQELENYLNRPIEPVRVRETLRADDMGWVYLRVTPVHQIISVTRSDGTVTPVVVIPWAELAMNDDYRQWDAWGNPDEFRIHVGVGAPFTPYPTPWGNAHWAVEYIAGYNGYVDAGLKLANMRVAAREVEMQFDDSMSLRGGQTEAASDSDNRQKGWTIDELTAWDRLRRRVVA
jgi:hypothetical protein